MLKLQLYGKTAIEFDMEPGLYSFDNESSTGKTYICQLIKILRSEGNLSCATYTLGDMDSPMDFYKKASNCDVIVFDRADMYLSSKNIEYIDSTVDNKIVILDCKLFPDDVLYLRTCFIKMEKDYIGVVG